VVNLGIICEGETELIHFNGPAFNQLLKSLDINLVGVVETGSKTQYFADRLSKHRQILLDKGAQKIIALVDLDRDSCITFTKQSIPQFENQLIIVAVKEFENWYLADTAALSNLLGRDTIVDLPEEENEAEKAIVRLRGKGFGNSKPRLANAMHRNGFTIENAARHPSCPSACYFLTKLQTLASAN
jgi:hypothetical protein